MRRKIYDRLKKWKTDKCGKTALLIEGARRVGKSYIVEEFAKNEYDTYAMINFSHNAAKISRLFSDDTSDIPLLLQKLSDLCGVTFIPRKTLIIFDEVQMCPKARECIKFLVEDGRYDYIETGSLVSIHDNVKDIVIPSEEEKVKMYPMDFEEFCWAMGNETAIPSIRRHFKEKTPFGKDVHDTFLGLFRQYVVVGGMPKAVETYVKTKDFGLVEEEKRMILSLYAEDVGKRSDRFRRRTAALFNAVPSELSRHDKEFRITAADANGKSSNYDEPMYWLEDSMVVNICHNTDEPTRALGMNMKQNSVKIYMGDTGLLVTMAIGRSESAGHEVYRALLQDRLHLNEGMFMENAVAQMLRCNGHDLYFHSFYKKNGDGTTGSNRYEIDFLTADGKKVSPIEVKSGRSDVHASLDYIMKTQSKHLGQAYVLHTKDLKKEGNVLYLPIYMAICL